ncbi:hypothetical protein [Fibrella forsythiae]|uniref:Uncharacterized protein n=1 Tax=Fibrella forsythiae TaxID=2817061 RepID=A0ABS3JSL8_9BACT|nr:hypothetical protein [Fibrella forsythiae]MBO0952438.1 hypothetical protein [Fibrella forsythiae]
MPNRLLHRFLTLSLAGLLFLLHSGIGPSLRAARQPVKTAASASKPRKATEQKEETIVKAALDEAVVSPALSFDFSQVTYLLFANDIRLLTLDRPLLRRVFDVPQYYSSYLRQVFGHLIAPNAP